MSASGTKRTSLVALSMSAFDPKRTCRKSLRHVLEDRAKSIREVLRAVKIETVASRDRYWLHTNLLREPSRHRFVNGKRIAGDE